MWKPPPPLGSLNFEMDLQPASLQSSPKLKHRVKNQVASIVKPSEYLLSGEVQVCITWLLHERLRYHGVHSPDIDNILKPLLDGMSGPNGLLVNDCQVQSVHCHWVDWTSDQHRLQFEIRFQPEAWIPKKGVQWVEVRDRLCMPLDTHISPSAQLTLIQAWENMFDTRSVIADRTGDYYTGELVMPCQKPFHRAKLKGYTIVAIDTIKERLKQA